MKNIIKRILREQLNPIKWVKPHFEDEEEEFELTASEIGDDYEETLSSLINGYWNSTIEVLTDEEWSQMENTDSWGLETEEAIYNVIGGYGRSNERILKHSLEPLRNGGVVETPIVLYMENYPPYLIAGNTRLSACKVLGITPMVTKIYL
jgi:ParB-like chromosome segregation protein Spo0J